MGLPLVCLFVCLFVCTCGLFNDAIVISHCLALQKIIVNEIQRCENWMTNLAESSKERCGSKRGVLPVLVVMFTISQAV
jgi:hypothetical protein